MKARISNAFHILFFFPLRCNYSQTCLQKVTEECSTLLVGNSSRVLKCVDVQMICYLFLAYISNMMNRIWWISKIVPVCVCVHVCSQAGNIFVCLDYLTVAFAVEAGCLHSPALMFWLTHCKQQLSQLVSPVKVSKEVCFSKLIPWHLQKKKKSAAISALDFLLQSTGTFLSLRYFLVKWRQPIWQVPIGGRENKANIEI